MEMVLKVAVVGALVFVVASTFWGRGRTVDSSEARRLVQEGALLIDVRSPGEFAAGHIDGARNIPVDQIASRLSELEPKERAVVVYCRSGQRSSAAAGTLRGAGFANVYDLGAMSRW